MTQFLRKVDPRCDRCENGFVTGVYVCRKSQLPDRGGKCEKCFNDVKGCSFQHICNMSTTNPHETSSNAPYVSKEMPFKRKRDRSSSLFTMGSSRDTSSSPKKKVKFSKWLSLVQHQTLISPC